MKAKSEDAKDDELRPEYPDFGESLREGVQGKYAARYEEGTNLPSVTETSRAAPKTDRGRGRTTA